MEIRNNFKKTLFSSSINFRLKLPRSKTLDPQPIQKSRKRTAQQIPLCRRKQRYRANAAHCRDTQSVPELSALRGCVCGRSAEANRCG